MMWKFPRYIPKLVCHKPDIYTSSFSNSFYFFSQLISKRGIKISVYSVSIYIKPQTMKRINFKTALVAVLGIGLLAGCASSAHIEKDDKVNFSKYKTFTWLHGDNGKLEDQSDLIESKIRDAVTKEFEKIGWKETKSKPDVILDYDVLVERSSKEQKEPVYSQPYSRLVYNPYTRRYATIFYPSQFLGYESYEKIIKEGTITITMIDAKTDKMVWQGWTTGEVNNRNLTNKEIQKAVAGIFKKSDLAKR